MQPTGHDDDDDDKDDDDYDDEIDNIAADYMRQTGTGSRFTIASAFPRLVFATSGNHHHNHYDHHHNHHNHYHYHHDHDHNHDHLVSTVGH